MADDTAGALVRKLERIFALSEGEREAVLALPLTVRVVEADTDIIREGDRPTQCCLVLEGFTCRYKSLPDGRRQIVGFYIPGDIPDLQTLHLDVVDHSLSTLVRSRLGFIQHRDLLKLMRDHPRIGDAFWRDTLMDAAAFREWLVVTGTRTAHEAISHLLCELMVRHRAVGLTTDDSIELPVTQQELGDALGLSTVHVNRVLQDLRAENLITLRGGHLTVLNWEGLKQRGLFSPIYLHLTGDREARI